MSQFRRLCILKGIYPVQPKNAKKIANGDSTHRAFYLRKDITHLSHEPLLNKFREFSIYTRKLNRIRTQQRWLDVKRFQETQPEYSLDHLVKERYPSFADALRDLDDALCMIFLFAKLPQTEDRPTKASRTIPLSSSSGAFLEMSEENCSQICSKLADEFMFYVIESKCLKKCFISIKGIYYQAEIQGIPITWVAPHSFPQVPSAEVDFRVMHTFLEFYATLLGFVNFRLFKSLSLVYPPEPVDTEALGQTDSSLSLLKPVFMEGICVPVELDQQNLLFDGLTFFISREVPRTPFEFVIRAFGGSIAWDGCGSSKTESDSGIHFHVMDRPNLPDSIAIGRAYVQPQFVFDCINAGKILDALDYAPGKELPPHLSPFVDASQENAVERREEKDEEEEENDEIEHGIGARPSNNEVMEELKENSESETESASTAAAVKAKQEKERKAMAISMLPKKHRDLLSKSRSQQ